jgi:solute:Na+ symporter, SSS family
LVFIIVSVKTDGGFSAIFSVGNANGKFQFTNWTWDYTIASAWVVLIGNFLSNIAPYISDQSIVQRYMTTPDLKQARQSLWFTFWFLMPNTLMFFLMGTALYVFYKASPHLLSPTMKTDAILPWFVMQEMPAGASGLVIAGIFAAAMSSLDSAMHSSSTAIVTDFYCRFKPDSSEKFNLSLARWLTGILGAVAVAFALIMAAAEVPSILDLFMKLLGLLGGGLAGVFLLGMLTRRANGIGALVGIVASSILVLLAQKYTRMHFFLYGAVGLISSVFIGYLASIPFWTKTQNLRGLTVFTSEIEKSE